jgi:zinc protease
VKAVTTEQVRAFHKRFYSAAQGEFTAVGDMDVAAVRKALDSALGSWRAPAEGGASLYACRSRWWQRRRCAWWR